MAFRDRNPASAESLDPLARFFELDAAFARGRGLFDDAVPGRLLAANLVLIPGEPAAVVEAVAAATAELTREPGELKQVSRSLYPLLAAAVIERDDSPGAIAGFVAEVARARAVMRGLGLRRYASYEVIAILILRVHNHGAAISDDQLARVQAIYEAMKTHHWLLTGPEDLPACAFLATTALEPAAIGARANAIYEALRTRAKLWRGDPLQTASNVLALSSLAPEELAERFALLIQAFDEAGVRVRQGDYDELALLCFLARPAARIVETVDAYTDAIRERLGLGERAMAFTYAANLAFARLVARDDPLASLADAKALLDMQMVVAARQAAVAAAAAGSA